MGNILGVPIPYALRRTLRNEEGIATGVKEVMAYSSVQRYYKTQNKRLNLYEPFFSNDYEEMGLKIPKKEEELEYQRQIPAHNTEGLDSILFCGFNSSEEKLLVNISRNSEGLSSVFLYLAFSDKKCYRLPQTKLWQTPLTGKDSFAAGGLRLRCLVPMRKWRISFNGILEEDESTSGKKRYVFMKFSFTWSASSNVFDLKSDIPSSFVANCLSKRKWDGYSPDIKKELKDVDCYVQAGNLTGTVQIDGEEEIIKLFWGSRKRSFETKTADHALQVDVEYFGYFQEGEMLYIGTRGSEDLSKSLKCGFIVQSNSIDGPIEELEIKSTEDRTTNMEMSKGKFCWKASFGHPTHQMEMKLFTKSMDCQMLPATLNGEPGNGLMVATRRSSLTGSEQHPLKIVLPALGELKPGPIDLVMSLRSPSCRYPEISGGKGSSLSNLHYINRSDKTFSVPKGVVVTTKAYELFIRESSLESVLEKLQICAGKFCAEDFRKECEKVSLAIIEKELPFRIKQSLREELAQTLGENFETIRVAVRSSASGEDSEEMSAAGQMKTFLGVKSSEKIFEAVVQCWASQFEYIAAQYKRQYGQLLNSPMAVVVQEMVDPEVAGVMFTCDPVTGNPSHITITANYGIGESVVSATSEPDTIAVLRSPEGDLEIESVQIGRKSIMTIMSDEGVSDEHVPENVASKCSLSNSLSLKLAKLGIMIEEAYGCQIDIEWAIKENELFLLQARPVTTFDKETNFEIIHERDSQLRSEKEWHSIANVGEVFPGSTSPLGLESMTKFCFESMVLRIYGKRDKNMIPWSPYFIRNFGNFGGHLLFNVLDGLLRFYNGKQNHFTDAQMIGTFGRVLDNKEMFSRAVERNKLYPSINIPAALFYTLGDMMFASQHLARNTRNYRKYEVDLSHVSSAEEMYHELLGKWITLAEPFSCHFKCSFLSSIGNSILYAMLSATAESKECVYNDVAYVLSSCYKVESVDVPFDIEKLASDIIKDYGIDFKDLETREALMWLERSDTAAGIRFQEFLNKHGHRCVKEFDLYSKPWGNDPLPLVKIIQDTMVTGSNKNSLKPSLTTEETIRNLKTKLSWSNRFQLKFIVPICRKGVGLREGSKSLMIGLVNSLRKAYRQFAERMVLEGRLPSAELVYFLYHDEILQLLKTRSPKLIQKSVRRRQLFPETDAMVLPELTEGFIVPFKRNLEVTVPEGSFCLKGVPVSQGVATGRARVATSLKEAAEIKAGEILIAHSTDIGWSPYFPMLGGVVTELGGLISHGAVVAREYGLPCVVSAVEATQLFRTGDLVKIDGGKGTIERIEE